MTLDFQSFMKKTYLAKISDTLVSHVDMSHAAAFSAGSFTALILRLALLIYIRDLFPNLPPMVIATAVIMPSFCFFTALGFHREFYSAYIAKDSRNLHYIYRNYISNLSTWLLFSLMIFVVYMVYLDYQMEVILIIGMLIIADRVQDEYMRLHFFKKNLAPWLIANLIRTFFPILISLLIFDFPVVIAMFIAGFYVLVSIVCLIPNIFYKCIGLPKRDLFVSEFKKQGIYNLGSQLRRNADRLASVPLLSSEIAFSYNILVQIAAISVLAFEKFLNILERQSYLKRDAVRTKINRLPFFIVSTSGALIYISASSSFQDIPDVEYIVFSLCVLAWVVAVANREFEFSWWKGNPAVFSGSLISIFSSIAGLSVLSIVSKSPQFELILYPLTFTLVPLVSLFFLNLFRHRS